MTGDGYPDGYFDCTLSPGACTLSPMPQCPRCNKRPGKRFCPALRTKICALCCAQDRMIELPCPETCSYLIEARTSVGHREKELRRKEASDRRTLILNDRALVSVHAIEVAVVQAQRGIGAFSFRDMKDADMLAAVENCAKNLDTEESGLIYEHRSHAPRVDELSRSIKTTFDEMFKDVPVEHRPRNADLTRALNYTREGLQAHLKRPSTNADSARSYLRFISLFHPWPAESTSPLIV